MSEFFWESLFKQNSRNFDSLKSALYDQYKTSVVLKKTSKEVEKKVRRNINYIYKHLWPSAIRIVQTLSFNKVGSMLSSQFNFP